MKKNIKFFAVAIAVIMTIGSLFFTSCNKNEESPIPNNDTPSCETKALSLTDAQREAIAQQFALSMVGSPNSYEELYRFIFITLCLQYGKDYYLCKTKDNIWKPRKNC